MIGVGYPVSATADVATEETTSSTSYTDLATVGPAITLSPGRTTDQMLFISSVTQGVVNQSSLCSVAIAGATALDADSIFNATESTARAATTTRPILASGVANGGTHTMKYRVTGGTALWNRRRISAFTLS